MLSHQQTSQFTTITPSHCSLVPPPDFPFLCVPAQRDLSPPFHSLKGAMSYPPARRDVAGYDLSLLYPVSDPIVGNIHPRDPLSAAAPLSSGPRQPQLYTTQVEKQVCGPTNQTHHPLFKPSKLSVTTINPFSLSLFPASMIRAQSPATAPVR